MKPIYTLVLFMLATGLTMAQNDSNFLSTDRPFRTNTAYTLGKGMLQIESGMDISRNKFDSDLSTIPTVTNQTINLNTTLIRYGLSDKVEFTLSQSIIKTRVLYDNSVISDATNTSVAPTVLVMRVHLFKEKGWRPQISAQAHLFSSPFSKNFEVDFVSSAQLNFQHNLQGGWALAYNVGLQGVQPADPFYSLLLAKQVVPRLRAFVEYSSERFARRSYDDFAGYGLQYQLSDHVQIDAFGRRELTSDIPTSTFGLGFSARIPGSR